MQTYTHSTHLLIILTLLAFASTAHCTIWQVGPARTYTLPSAVAAMVNNGDTVLIDAGTYTDCAVWTKSNLLLQGTGPGYAHCQTAVCGQKGVWVINAGANNITIENMEFSGASISGGSGGNGAGLRAQGGSYTIRHCYFHDNQNGILCNPNTGNDSADVLIENSVFAYNGCPTGDASGCNPGYEHNMYIGSGYRSFTLQYCYTHGAINGHNIKTRASNNYILYNRIMDLADGTSSYDVDIAQGGPTIIMGNLIEGGPHKVNHSIICYNEGSTNAPPQNLYFINNTVVNDQTTGYFLFMPLSSNDTLTMLNNIFAGPGAMFNGSPGFAVIDSGYNLRSTSIAAVGLANAAAYDYHLTDTSLAINAGTGAGMAYDIGPVTPFSLTPIMQYVDSASSQPRSIAGGTVDIGAYEFPSPYDTIRQTICSNDSFVLNGLAYYTAGSYNDTLQASAGGDSIVTLNLTVNPASYDTLNESICSGQTYTLNGHFYSNPGTFNETLTAANGCDSIITLNLTVNQPVTFSYNDTICAGQPYTFNGMQLSDSGSYSAQLTSSSGCDSTVTLHLKVNPAPAVTLSWDSMVADYSFYKIDDSTINWCLGDVINISLDLLGGNPGGGIYSGHGVTNNALYEDSFAFFTQYDTITYTYTDTNSCSANATNRVLITVCGAINDLSLSNQLQINPNPANTILFITITGALPNTTTLYDVRGQLIYTGNFEPELDVANLSPGAYFIEVKSGPSKSPRGGDLIPEQILGRKMFVKM